MQLGLILIEVCDINLADSPELMALEEEFPDVTIIENGCMSQCNLCASSPYVFMNGEIIKADSKEDLISSLRQKLNDILHSLS